METTIHKQALALGGGVYELPAGAEPVHVGEQHGGVCLWYRCDPTAQLAHREFVVVGTGYFVGDLPHVGTVVMSDGFVWHVLDGGETVREAAAAA